MQHTSLAPIGLLFSVTMLLALLLPLEQGQAFQKTTKGPTPILGAENTASLSAGSYRHKSPQHWGEEVPGVIVGIDTDKQIAALTLDACQGDYDRELIEYLRQEEIPATLFVTCLWIEENQGVFEELAQDPLFSIANHGTRHLPLSVTGQEAYGIKGTEGPEGVLQEVLPCSRQIEKILGKRPRYFRSGTAHYDEIAVRMVNDLGLEVIGFTVAADEGASLGKEEIVERMQQVEPGGIILAHMNHPESEVAEGLKEGITALQRQGYEFVRLKDHEQDFLRKKQE